MIRNRPPSPQTRQILAALLVQPLDWRHGYELHKLTGLSSGTLYPLLMRLEQKGFLESKWMDPERPGRPPRHAYRLSSDGAAFARGLGEAPSVQSSSTRGALA